MLAKTNGDDERALVFFQKAKSLGLRKADTQVEQLEMEVPKQTITYLIETTE